MHKEGLETYKDLIFCFFVHLLDRKRIIEIAIIGLYVITYVVQIHTCISPCSHNNLHTIVMQRVPIDISNYFHIDTNQVS